MSLTRKQFDVLEVFATANVNEVFTQRQLEEATNYSLGTINKTMKELTEAGFVANGLITNNGLNARWNHIGPKRQFLLQLDLELVLSPSRLIHQNLLFVFMVCESLIV